MQLLGGAPSSAGRLGSGYQTEAGVRNSRVKSYHPDQPSLFAVAMTKLETTENGGLFGWIFFTTKSVRPRAFGRPLHKLSQYLPTRQFRKRRQVVMVPKMTAKESKLKRAAQMTLEEA